MRNYRKPIGEAVKVTPTFTAVALRQLRRGQWAIIFQCDVAFGTRDSRTRKSPAYAVTKFWLKKSGTDMAILFLVSNEITLQTTFFEVAEM